MSTKKEAKPVLTGSDLGKSFQEKQVAALERVIAQMEKSIDGYTDSIGKLNNEMNELYYQVKEREEYLESMESDKKEELQKLEQEKTAWIEDRIKTLKTQLAELQKEFATKQKDAQVDFDIAIKESKEAVLTELLEEFELARISTEDLETLYEDRDVAKAALKAGFSEDIAKVTKKLNREHDNAMEVARLEYEKSESSNTATIEQLQNQVSFLNEQLEKSEERINNILMNQVKIAEATKAVTVNTTAK